MLCNKDIQVFDGFLYTNIEPQMVGLMDLIEMVTMCCILHTIFDSYLDEGLV